MEVTLRYDPKLRYNNTFRVAPIEGTNEAYLEAAVKLNETAGWHWLYFKIGNFGRDVPTKPRSVAVMRLGEGEWRTEAAAHRGSGGPLPLLTFLLTNIPKDAPFFQ